VASLSRGLDFGKGGGPALPLLVTTAGPVEFPTTGSDTCAVDPIDGTDGIVPICIGIGDSRLLDEPAAEEDMGSEIKSVCTTFYVTDPVPAAFVDGTGISPVDGGGTLPGTDDANNRGAVAGAGFSSSLRSSRTFRLGFGMFYNSKLLEFEILTNA